MPQELGLWIDTMHDVKHRYTHLVHDKRRMPARHICHEDGRRLRRLDASPPPRPCNRAPIDSLFYALPNDTLGDPRISGRELIDALRQHDKSRKELRPAVSLILTCYVTSMGSTHERRKRRGVNDDDLGPRKRTSRSGRCRQPPHWSQDISCRHLPANARTP